MKRTFILQKGVVSSFSTLVLLVLTLTTSAQVPAPVSPDQDVVAKINEYMDAVVKIGKFNGSLLIARDCKVVVSKGYGMSNLRSLTKRFSETTSGCFHAKLRRRCSRPRSRNMDQRPITATAGLSTGNSIVERFFIPGEYRVSQA